MTSGGLITATRRHSEVVDPYRQGLPVAAPPAGACRGEARGRGEEHGTVLVLMPAAVLVFLVLGALAVDAAAVLLA